MYYVIAIIIALLLEGCTPAGVITLPPGRRIHTEEATRIMQEFVEELRHEKGIEMTDSNIFYDPYISTIQMEFVTQALIELPEAREWMVDIVEGILARFNQSPILGPDIGDYPLTGDNVELYVTFESFYGKYIDEQYMGWMYLENGVCFYYTFLMKDHSHNDYQYRREKYSKTREIAVYQREAAQRYKDLFEAPKPSAFGPERYRDIENHKLLHDKFRAEIEDR